MTSAARQAGPLWNATEDVILLNHVARHGTSQWGVLQASGLLPRRDNKACCNRFIVLKRNYQQNRIKSSQVVKALLSALRSNNQVKTCPGQARTILLPELAKMPLTSITSVADPGAATSQAPARSSSPPPSAALRRRNNQAKTFPSQAHTMIPCPELAKMPLTSTTSVADPGTASSQASARSSSSPSPSTVPAPKQSERRGSQHGFLKTAMEGNASERGEDGAVQGAMCGNRTSVCHTEATIPRSTGDVCEEASRNVGGIVDHPEMDHLSLTSRVNQSAASSTEFLACLLQAAAAVPATSIPAAPEPTASASEPEASGGGGTMACGTLKRPSSDLWRAVDDHTLISSKKIKSLPEFWHENEDHAVPISGKANAHPGSDTGTVIVGIPEPTWRTGSLPLGEDGQSQWAPYAGLPWCEGGCLHPCQSCQAAQPNLSGLRPDALLDALSSGPLSMVLFGL
ncbi:unnamed protein product [Closterium sp. NIES-64]|nr:unnamed protein product [Closterium sp. NIES-64]